MRIFLICLLVLVAAAAGYAYRCDPDGCAKLGHDFMTLVTSLTTPVDSATPSPDSSTATAASVPTPVPTPTPTPTPTPAPSAAVLAEAYKTEAQREQDHPYYTMAEVADAEALARLLHRPLAWVVSDKNALTAQNPDPGTLEALTQMAMDRVKSRTVIIFCNGAQEFPDVPEAVCAEFYHMDDGPMPDGHHFYMPKVVFSSPDATQTFGRVAKIHMTKSGAAAVDAALNSVLYNPQARAILSR